MDDLEHGDPIVKDAKTGALRKAKKGEASTLAIVDEGKMQRAEDCEFVVGGVLLPGDVAVIDSRNKLIAKGEKNIALLTKTEVDIPKGTGLVIERRTGNVLIKKG